MPQNRKTVNNVKSTMTSREICLEVIVSVLEKGEFYNAAVTRALADNRDLKPVDRAFIAALTEGTVERAIELDYIIDRFSSKKVEKLKANIRNILRMAVYQIKYMDKVPDNAAVNEAVKLAVKKGFGGLRGFVNGVLRNIARNIDDIQCPEAYIRYSMPKWIVNHLEKELGSDGMIRAMEYYLSKPELSIRPVDMNETDELYKRLIEAEYEVHRGNILNYALRIKNSGKVTDIPGYDKGLFFVQDESSMMPAHIVYEYLKSKGCETACNTNKLQVLDMCSAPGGKVLHLAAMLSGKAHFCARDLSKTKTDKIRDNIRKAGYTGIEVSEKDALVYYEEDAGQYDVIIADLPCSGLGVIAKKPDIKYNIKKEDLNTLADIQSKMLDNAAGYLRPNGIIVYSTCTINAAENQENCRRFLEKHSEYKSVDVSAYIPEVLHGSVTEEGYLRIEPGKYETDGFFVALFEKKKPGAE